jgi:hypothetical protein
MKNFITCTHHMKAIKLRRIAWSWHIACMGEVRREFKILLRKHEENRPYRRRRLRLRCDDNIKMDLKQIGCRGMEKNGVGM